MSMTAGSTAHLLFDILAGLLVVLGLGGAVVPLLPGIPLIFSGLWIFAAVDHYRHVGWGWLLCIAGVAAIGLVLDFAAAALGAKRVGASARAVSGALVGTVLGLFFGIPGLLFGPFLGALVGELSTGRSFNRAANVGVATWIGLLFGTVAKVAASIIMIAVFSAMWLWNAYR
jgi:hypothetical protein